MLVCYKEAKYYDKENCEFVCEECSIEVEEDDKMNISNSPRTGICCYY